MNIDNTELNRIYETLKEIIGENERNVDTDVKIKIKKSKNLY